ncbi:MAG: hypothetical protein JWR50_4191 [Mucilaginibacter sp.]|nr:hypothetical protein [Mucilaginibacter sp.]
MAQPEKNRYHYFYIINVKLRKKNSTKDLLPKDYIRLFKDLYNKKIHAESSTSKHCIIRFMFDNKDSHDNIEYLSGTLAQFTYIQNERWFNLQSLDLDNEFKVPDGLFPDAVITEYVFIPAAHRFCYRSSSEIRITPYSAKKFLEIALNEVCKEDEIVHVDVESDKTSIETIFSAKELRKLIIDINYSNLDTGDDYMKFVEDDLKDSNGSRFKFEASQKPGVSLDIKKSKILTGALEASVSNGDAEATILDDNDRVQKIKTSNFPRREFIHGTLTRFNDLVAEKVMRIFRPNGNKTNN